MPVLVAAVIIGNPFSAHVLWIGNTTLIVAAALMACWWFDLERRPLLAGFFLALASIKPQFALLPGLWMLVERRWMTCMSAAIWVGLFASFHLIRFGFVESIEMWLKGLGSYQWIIDHVDGPRRQMGLEPFLNSLAIPDWIAIPTGAGIAILIWKVRHALFRLEILAVLCALSILFLPSHNYDLVVLAPLAATVALQTRGRPHLQALAIFAAVLLMIPQRFILKLDIEPLTFWRIPLVCFVLVLALILALRRVLQLDPTHSISEGSAMLHMLVGKFRPGRTSS